MSSTTALARPVEGVPCARAGAWHARDELQSHNGGLLYAQQRWLDPSTGRFLSLDPVQGELSAPLSTQGFTYAHANPTRFTDPDGRFPTEFYTESRSLPASPPIAVNPLDTCVGDDCIDYMQAKMFLRFTAGGGFGVGFAGACAVTGGTVCGVVGTALLAKAAPTMSRCIDGGAGADTMQGNADCLGLAADGVGGLVGGIGASKTMPEPTVAQTDSKLMASRAEGRLADLFRPSSMMIEATVEATIAVLEGASSPLLNSLGGRLRSGLIDIVFPKLGEIRDPETGEVLAGGYDIEQGLAGASAVNGKTNVSIAAHELAHADLSARGSSRSAGGTVPDGVNEYYAHHVENVMHKEVTGVAKWDSPRAIWETIKALYPEYVPDIPEKFLNDD